MSLISLQAEDQRDTMAERVARNDAAFREANERIAAFAASIDAVERRLPFLCECADPACTTVVQLSPDEYDGVRSSSIRFINAPGHSRNGEGWARVVEERDGYTVVEKIGEAAELVAELDPRAQEPA